MTTQEAFNGQCRSRSDYTEGAFSSLIYTVHIFIRPQNECIMESACLSVRVSVFVQNTILCQSAGVVIKSHSVTTLVHSRS